MQMRQRKGWICFAIGSICLILAVLVSNYRIIPGIEWYNRMYLIFAAIASGIGLIIAGIALERYISRGIMLTILGSIILILVFFIIINTILANLYYPYLIDILRPLLPSSVVLSIISIILLIIGIYIIFKKRKQGPIEKGI